MRRRCNAATVARWVTTALWVALAVILALILL
jgi:hypothetical protein